MSSEYDCLVTPPSKSLTNQLYANAYSMALKSRLESNGVEEGCDNIPSENQVIKATTRRPSSSGISTTTRSSGSTIRPSTPTRRPSSSGTSTTTRITRSSRSTIKPCTPISSSRTSHADLTSASIARKTTPTRPMSAPSTKPGSRSSTPARRPPTPTGSSTVVRSKPAPSSTLRSRPWEPYEMPGFSLEAPSNLRTTLPDRPQTASSSRRIRAFGTSSSRSASIERAVARRQSCSPSRIRVPIGNANGAVSSLRGRRANTSNDDGSHVNMRTLAPPRLTGNDGGGNSTTGKSSCGAKSSINMTSRRMDNKRGSMMGSFRPLMTNVSATDSLYSSVRSSGTRRKRPVSSSGSSETSINILSLDDNLSDMSYS